MTRPESSGGMTLAGGVCHGCGCTDDDCSGCIAKTGFPCSWVEPGLCSACAGQRSAYQSADYTWEYIRNLRAFARRMGTLDEPNVRRRLRKMEQFAEKHFGANPVKPGARPWRVGANVGRTIYDAEDRLIGVMDTRALAEAVVVCVNEVSGVLTELDAEDERAKQ